MLIGVAVYRCRWVATYRKVIALVAKKLFWLTWDETALRTHISFTANVSTLKTHVFNNAGSASSCGVHRLAYSALQPMPHPTPLIPLQGGEGVAATF